MCIHTNFCCTRSSNSFMVYIKNINELLVYERIGKVQRQPQILANIESLAIYWLYVFLSSLSIHHETTFQNTSCRMIITWFIFWNRIIHFCAHCSIARILCYFGKFFENILYLIQCKYWRCFHRIFARIY